MDPYGCNMEPDTPTARAVRGILARDRITRAELCRRTGLTRGNLQRKLSGRRDFTVGEVFSIAEAVGCQPSELLPPLEVAW